MNFYKIVNISKMTTDFVAPQHKNPIDRSYLHFKCHQIQINDSKVHRLKNIYTKNV